MSHQEMDAFLKNGLTLLEAQKHARDRIRERWREDAGELLDTHFLLVSAISSIITTGNESTVMHEFSHNSSKRMAIHAALIQGIDLTEIAVSEGLTFQAAALIRQQMYAIESLNDLKTGRPRGPSIKLNFLRPMGKLYGQLSALAKLCTDSMNLDIATAIIESEGVKGPSARAQYDFENTKLFYGVSCLLLLYLVIDMIEIQEAEMHIEISPTVQPALTRVTELLHRANIINAEAVIKT